MIAHSYGITNDADVCRYILNSIITDYQFDEYPAFHNRLLKIKRGDQTFAQAMDIPDRPVFWT